MIDSCEELISQFISDPSSAVQKCQQIITSVAKFESYKDFYNYHLEHTHVSTCQKEWAKPQLAIHCIDCSISQQSCFCLQCFLEGQHPGHEYLIRPNSTGNCDCGDLSLWKRSGFCPKHYGLDENSCPEDYLDIKLRTVLTDTIFKAAFSSLKQLLEDKGSKISVIVQFLISFLKFGDGFRRLLVISLTEKIDFQDFFNCIIDGSEKFNEYLQQFFGLLINDQVFKFKFSTINYKIVSEKIVPLLIKNLETGETKNNILVWDHFWFHSYSLSLYKYNIEKYSWDWVEFAIRLLKQVKEPIKLIGKPDCPSEIPEIFMSSLDLSEASQIQPNEPTQNLFDRLFTEILNCGTTNGLLEGKNDTIIISSFKEDTDEDRFSMFFYFNYIFYQIIDCFKSKKGLKLDKMFNEFDKTIDISPIYKIGKNIVESSKENVNENDKFFARYFLHEKDTDSNLDNYKSFHNGASFHFSYPMFYSLLYLIRSDKYNRAKIAKFLSKKEYQNLRVKLSIVTLKNLLSNICFHQSLIPRNNFALLSMLNIYINNPKMVSFGIPLVFPLFQLLIGIQCEDRSEMNEFCFKEFIAFEMAREIGLFDNFTGDDYQDESNVTVIQKQMIFSFLYIAILVIIERTLFNFNGNEFIKEQIIFGLKQGNSNLNILKDMFDTNIVQPGRYMSDFNKIISEVAITRKKSNSNSSDAMGSGNQDVLFDLRTDVENKNISAINSFNDEKVIMNNQISKHPETLIKIPSFEPEESYFFHQPDEDFDCNGLNVRLKEFLMTPTVFAVLYHTLRSSSESESPQVDLNDHLAMNILILISKFLREKEKGDQKIIDNVINYDSSISDLVSKLKRSVFNYKENDGGDPTIENTLTTDSFNMFLKLKICPESKEPKSFVDILLEKGEIGKTVLNQMSISVEGNIDNQKEIEDVNKMKKMRANKLKQDIMNHYKSMTASFNASDDNINNNGEDSLMTTSIEKDVCSICSMTKSKEVLCYPLYIYKTKFPFIVDKPPLISLKISEAENEQDVAEDDDLNEEEDNDDNNDDDDIDEPTLDSVFAMFLNDHPELVLRDDMDDELKERILNLHKVIRESIESHIDEIRQRWAERQMEKLEKIKIREEIRKKKEQEKAQKALQKAKENENSDSANQTVVKQLTAGLPFVIQFGICQHPIHHTCIEQKNFFNCPIDRSPKNGFLPAINDLSKDVIFSTENHEKVTNETLSNELKDALETFITKYSALFKNKNEIDVFVELIKSLSGLITTFEIRLRNLPDCLDSKKNRLLARNLFLTTWYAYRMRGKPVLKLKKEDDDDIDSRLTIFQKFVRKLIESDQIIENNDNELFKSLVSSFLESLKTRNDKEILLFLRRVCLAENFLLNKNIDDVSKFIDWDEILSAENLSEKFNVSFKSEDIFEFEFKPFRFSELPKEFLRFLQKPFNFPVDQTRIVSLFNIFDYNYLIKNYDDFAENEKEKSEEVYKNELNQVQPGIDLDSFLSQYYSNKNYPSVLLFIGKAASNVIVVDGLKLVDLRPFYLDKYGCVDIGYLRSQPLFLNEERFDRFMDEILSGDFSNDLRNY